MWLVGRFLACDVLCGMALSLYDARMATLKDRPLSVTQATKPEAERQSAEDQAWHDEQTREAIGEADAGDFAATEEVKAIVRKFIPDG